MKCGFSTQLITLLNLLSLFNAKYRVVRTLGRELVWPVVIPVLHNLNRESANDVADAISNLNLSSVSVSLRHATAMSALDVFLFRLRDLDSSCLVGASTITSEREISEVKHLGGGFVSSMYTPASFSRLSEKVGIPLLGGVCNQYEAESAVSNGVNSLKFYPATKSPPHILEGIVRRSNILRQSACPRFVAGSVRDADIVEYLKLDIAGFAIGIDCSDILLGSNLRVFSSRIQKILDYVNEMAAMATTTTTTDIHEMTSTSLDSK